MVEIDLNHLYKKYPNAAHDSVKDFDLLAAVNQQPFAWSQVLRIFPRER